MCRAICIYCLCWTRSRRWKTNPASDFLILHHTDIASIPINDAASNTVMLTDTVGGPMPGSDAFNLANTSGWSVIRSIRNRSHSSLRLVSMRAFQCRPLRAATSKLMSTDDGLILTGGVVLFGTSARPPPIACRILRGEWMRCGLESNNNAHGQQCWVNSIGNKWHGPSIVRNEMPSTIYRLRADKCGKKKSRNGVVKRQRLALYSVHVQRRACRTL